MRHHYQTKPKSATKILSKKGIAGCLLVSSAVFWSGSGTGSQVASALQLKDKFVFDDRQDKLMEQAKSEFEKKLVEEAQKDQEAARRRQEEQRKTDLEKQQEEDRARQAQQDQQKNQTKRSSIAHVPLKNINNQQYTGELYFGSPP